jgi:NADPH:quinone reductase-like Zn-dependent oxidoreductase
MFNSSRGALSRLFSLRSHFLPHTSVRPLTMKAIVSFGPKDARLVSDRPVPKLRDDYILVKNHSVALNPTDWKHIDFQATEGALVGCDFAGTVEEVGKDVTKSVKKGDRIAGFTHGVNKVEKEDGSFAEYIVAKGDVTYKIPDKMSFDEAATLGVGTITVGQGMFQSMGLPWPSKPSKDGEPILIYGGSSATGTLAVQFAKLYVFISHSLGLQPLFLRAKLTFYIQSRPLPHRNLFPPQL